MAYGQNLQTPNFANATGQTPSERWRFSTLNDMMLSIGLAGIDYNDSIMDTMEGQHALRILTDVIYEVQSEGWEFNTVASKELTLDANGRFKFDYAAGEPYVFSLVGQNDDLFVSQDGTLKSKTTREILGGPQDKITVTKMIIESWADMHFALSQYVAALATNKYQGLMVGDADKIRFGQNEIQSMYAKARRDEVRSGKYNILNSNFGQEVNR